VENSKDHIGAQLKRAREDAGLTVDDVTFRTRIPQNVVNALEVGDFTRFSSPLYARSFLSQYSNFMHISANRWLDALEPTRFVAEEAVCPIWKSAKRKKDLSLSPRRPSNRGIPMSVVVASSLVLLYAGVKGYQYLDRRLGDSPEVSSGNSVEKNSPESDSAVQENRLDSSSSQMASEGESRNPPPRAIIVR
jgi:cytoskeletal protein RodZ